MPISSISDLLKIAVDSRATDLHLVAHNPPIFRVDGELNAADLPPLSPDDVKAMLEGMLTNAQRETFRETQELDFSYQSLEGYYFRVNAHLERGNVAATVRIMPTHIPSAEELGLPPVLAQLARRRKGLIVIIGSAGTGKTTTMTYMVDLINRERKCKIITIEDPIEYIHQSKQSVIIQREVGSHTRSFANGLKYALRQDPDVVVIGEMRDLESMAMALTTAETGHLVLTTLHAPDTIESINRIIDVFPSGQQNQIRLQLAENLLAVIGQSLIPRKEAQGRVLATEIMIPNLSIRNMIRRGALMEIRGQLEEGGKVGMHSIEQCLSDLISRGIISREMAKEFAKHPNLLRD
ncbi:MAG: PilT/PilU family type 4a pilus ATPase [Candidatus Omnitrophota bacterium]|nr:PilT/PilU family type 4a pilus ATPase [Candidatus Omnitrophota bacterium]MDZ4243383.1 PilT/PilU family type 4a pilus ATPase [Candidatus Omnitrophota bacterium]